MSVSVDELSAKLEQLQEQLDELRALISELTAKEGQSVKDLYGVLAGKVTFSEADLEAAEVKLEWDKIDPPA
jgi:peptidoglycan hydrolase CwlO-like protein